MADRSQCGFTLVEMLLSITVIGVLAGLSVPLMSSFNNRNDLDIATSAIVQAVRRAETYARGSRGDSAWGVYVQGSSAVIYKGASYASRDNSADEAIGLDPATVSSQTDINFSRMTGTPSAGASISLSNPASNESRTVSVNSKGMVGY